MVEMGFRVRAKETASEGVKRIARRQIGKAVRDLSEEVENPDETIHDVRKRLKRIRALLRVVRPKLGKTRYRGQNAVLRDVGRRLSGARDARVLVETLEKLSTGMDEGNGKAEVEPVLRQLRERAESAEARLRDGETWEGLSSTLKRVRKAVKQWPLEGDEDWPVVKRGVARLYEKGYRALRRAKRDPTDETLHEWRKRVKDLWHVLELLRSVRPGFFETRANEAHELADLLGDDHDLAVLDEVLGSSEIELEGEGLRRLRVKIADRRVELQRQAFLRGPFVYDESPGTYVERLEAFWKAWRAESRAVRLSRARNF